MDIDVINILKKVFSMCDSLDKEKISFNNTTFTFKDIVTYDIYNFIKIISKENTNKRIDLFSKTFLHTTIDYGSIHTKLVDNEIVPAKSLVYFAKVDKELLHNKLQSSQLLIQLFITIGKYYLFSDCDKKDIDIDKFKDYIISLNNYAKLNMKDTQINLAVKKEQIIDNNENIDIENEKEIMLDEPEESLDKLIEKLNSLVGLSAVKEEVNKIINLIKITKKREERGIKTASLSLHLVFSGNPGTGKTTIARLLARIYQKLGMLSKGEFYEVDRSGLVGGYVGQTALKTQEVINKALGSILFIDEAYSLTHNKGEADFGQEAVDTLLKAMEDYRDDLIVIIAGYPHLMEEFLDSNPGLRSRFNKRIMFEDYNPDELYKIFELLCKNNELIITDDCKDFLHSYFDDIYNHRNEHYANGRDVRNYFEKVYSAQADRLSLLDDVSNEELQTFVIDDFRNIK